MTKNKSLLFILLSIASVFLGYKIWQLLRPVDIVAVHQRDNFSDVLVRNFPVTDKGKIAWWLEHKEQLKASYHIPEPASYGSFTITFWLFGEGYKERGKYDRLCFNDMQEKKNCIEKDAVFAVHNYNGNRVLFTVYDGTYLQRENGNIVKYEYK